MKDWNEYLKTLIFVETSVKSHSTLTIRETFRRAAEKGVTNVKLDNGGATLVGVTFKTYKAMADLYGWPSTWEGFVTMTFEEWERIVYHLYFEINADKIRDKSLALAIFDFYWHSGTAAVKTVQRIVNTTADGKLGPKTLAAINVNDPRQLHLRVTFERLKFLESIARKPSQRGFLEGWKNRVAYLTYE